MNFQSDSKKSGDHFEEMVLNDLIEKQYTNIWHNVEIENTGCEIDFIAQDNFSTIYVEAKGGYDEDKKRPGAKRTDNVKKAIANGSLIKLVDPSIYYIVYFSSKPHIGSYSDKMINLALEHKIINEVVYLEQVRNINENNIPYWNKDEFRKTN
jgi:hypothetical protein